MKNSFLIILHQVDRNFFSFTCPSFPKHKDYRDAVEIAFIMAVGPTEKVKLWVGQEALVVHKVASLFAHLSGVWWRQFPTQMDIKFCEIGQRLCNFRLMQFNMETIFYSIHFFWSFSVNNFFTEGRITGKILSMAHAKSLELFWYHSSYST